MKEGWHNDNYVILFDEQEQNHVTESYGLNEFLPGYVLVAMLGWDDFVVRNQTGTLFRVPTVPAIDQYLEKVQSVPSPPKLESDDRFMGKIKWYTTPIVFGGDPSSEENMTWLELKQHQDLVKWWNNKYRELTKQ